MIRGRDIICISSIEWDFLWQGHHEIAVRLARAGNRVLYIESTGVRSPGRKDARRIAARILSWVKDSRSGGRRPVEPGLEVCSPLMLPPFGPGWQRWINRRFLIPAIQRIAADLRMGDPLFLVYLPTDTTLDLLDSLGRPGSVIIYYCIADWGELATDRSRLRAAETALLQRADLVFTHPELTAHCAQWNQNIHLFPLGVDLELFSPATQPHHSNGAGSLAAEELSALPGPVLGYVGGLHRHIDFELLAAIARRRPDWTLVCVGPILTRVDALAGLPNVKLLGRKPHRTLPQYIRGFDVCLVPYVSSAYTDTVVPTKINEYLAMGKPVVSTPLPAVCRFNREHGVLILAPARPEAFVDAIEEALRCPSEAPAAARRRAVAGLSDWSRRVEEMCDLIESATVRNAGVP